MTQITKDTIKDIPSRQFADISDILDDMESQLDQLAVEPTDSDTIQTHWLTEVRTNVDMEDKWLALLRAGEALSTRDGIQAQIVVLGSRIEAIKKNYSSHNESRYQAHYGTLTILSDRLKKIDQACFRAGA